jgi:hypothetical protein
MEIPQGMSSTKEGCLSPKKDYLWSSLECKAVIYYISGSTQDV